MSSRRPHTAGWDVGERPAVPMPYITLPPYQPVHSHQRHEDGGFSSTRVGKNSERGREWQPHQPVPPPREAYLKCDTRERRDRQRRPGTGWASKLHSGTLDYRTVDELGLKPEALDLHSKPATQPPRLTIVDVAANLREEAEGGTKPAFQLEDGRAVRGGVKQFCMAYFKVLVPHKNMTLRVSVNALTGDPDIFVCNRNTHPTQSQHTWKSASAGDDVVTITPDDPLFYPGAFFVGVYGIYDSTFEICATLTRQRVQVRHATALEGTGYAEVVERLRAADLRRRCCKHGGGFVDLLESPRTLTPRPPQNTPRPPQTAPPGGRRGPRATAAAAAATENPFIPPAAAVAAATWDRPATVPALDLRAAADMAAFFLALAIS